MTRFHVPPARAAIRTLFCLLTLTPLTHAELPVLETDDGLTVTIDGELRPTYALDMRDADDSTAPQDYGTLRSVLGINLMPDDRVLVRIALQESRLLGIQYPNASPSTVFYAREAFLEVREVWDLPLSVKAGRFTVERGRGRLLGTNDSFLYGPHSFDGLELSGRFGDIPWQLLAAVIVEDEFASTINDHDPWTDWWLDYPWVNDVGGPRYLYALSADLFDARLQPLLYADISASRNEAIPRLRGKEQVVAALYYEDRFEDMSIRLDLAAQHTLLREEYVITDETGRELDAGRMSANAYLFAADVTWHSPYLADSEITLGIDRVFGDMDAGGQPLRVKNWPSLIAPFRDIGRFHGNLHYVWAFTDIRVSDIFARWTVHPTTSSRITASYHRFLQMDFSQSDESELVDRAQELFLEGEWTVNRWVTARAGYGVMLFKQYPQQLWYDPWRLEPGGTYNSSTDPAEYGFVQLEVRL